MNTIFMKILPHLKHQTVKFAGRIDLKQTLRFVVLIATPLCFINSFVFSLGSNDFFADWFHRFLLNYLMTFPQAVLYVSMIKWWDRLKKA